MAGTLPESYNAPIMTTSLKAFMGALVDYAGLFPPAGLAMEPAARNYFSYRDDPDSWMLGRFVCPAGKLQELADASSVFLDKLSPLAVSALSGAGESASGFLSGLEGDVESMRSFLDYYEGEVTLDALETRLPGALARERDVAGSVAVLLPAARERLADGGFAALPAFHEIVPAENPAAVFEAAIREIAEIRRDRKTPEGFKLRCGGIKADAFPEPAVVAHVILCCRDNGVPLKFTAGLHHPVRRRDKGLGATMHGFLNVLGGAVLAHGRRLDEKALLAILGDEDGTHFTFTEDAFAWKKLEVKTQEIENIRALVTSFGSCSFDEPREDLRALKLLEPASPAGGSR